MVVRQSPAQTPCPGSDADEGPRPRRRWGRNNATTEEWDGLGPTIPPAESRVRLELIPFQHGSMSSSATAVRSLLGGQTADARTRVSCDRGRVVLSPVPSVPLLRPRWRRAALRRPCALLLGSELERSQAGVGSNVRPGLSRPGRVESAGELSVRSWGPCSSHTAFTADTVGQQPLQR